MRVRGRHRRADSAGGSEGRQGRRWSKGETGSAQGVGHHAAHRPASECCHIAWLLHSARRVFFSLTYSSFFITFNEMFVICQVITFIHINIHEEIPDQENDIFQIHNFILRRFHEHSCRRTE